MRSLSMLGKLHISKIPITCLDIFMTNKLTPEEEAVIVRGETEAPFSGQYNNFSGTGTYICKRCGHPLFHSSHKFHSFCGWPSFDDEIPGAINRFQDPDGERVEIRCAKCDAHIGHLFDGEGFTPKNVRYCANSIAMNFIPQEEGSKEPITEMEDG